MTRRLATLTVLGLLLLTTVPPTAPAGPGQLCPGPDEVPGLGDDQARVLMGPQSQRFGFVPDCVTVPSGGTLSVASLDATIHPLGTTADQGDCWSHTYLPGETGRIQLSYEDGVVHVDGEPCPGLATETTDTYAILEVECFLHPLMQLDVVVTASGASF